MKYNKYIFKSQQKDKTILYNLFNDEILVVNEKITALLEKFQLNPYDIHAIHPQLYATLVEKRFIVDKEFNETVALIKRWDEKENNPKELTLIIIPTLNCNMRCWYCYESHEDKKMMPPRIVNGIERFVHNQIKKGEIKVLTIDFFGGEPLLCFKNICEPLLITCNKMCSSQNVKLKVHFTTNGYLLSNEVLTFLESLNTPVSLQITLDGNKDCHNRIRKLSTGKPSYDIIIKNIRNAIKYSIFVNCRINYTYDNIETIGDIIDEFKHLNEFEKNNILFTLQQVWQDNNNHSLQEEETEMTRLFKKNNLPVSSPSLTASRHCYADYENNFIVNPEGRIFKCTARDFTKDISEGCINDDGTLFLNDRYHKRMSLKRGTDACFQCFIYPICHANCSQFALERIPHITQQDCMFGYSKEEKERIIFKRINAIIENNSLNL